MKNKKHVKANLENYSKLFLQLGLVLSLIIIYALLQNKTFEDNIAILTNTNQSIYDDTEQIIEFKVEKPKKQLIQKNVVLDVFKKVDNDIPVEDVLFKNIDSDEPIDDNDITNKDIDESIDLIDEIDFIALEEAPLFPGCKGTREEKKACFTKKIGKFVNRKFNSNLAEELGLSSGVQRIYTLFKIDKNGNVIDIQASAPHKRLQQEAVRVIKLLPKMNSGKQGGNPVVVKYSLPIIFKVQ